MQCGSVTSSLLDGEEGVARSLNLCWVGGGSVASCLLLGRGGGGRWGRGPVAKPCVCGGGGEGWSLTVL